MLFVSGCIDLGVFVVLAVPGAFGFRVFSGSSEKPTDGRRPVPSRSSPAPSEAEPNRQAYGTVSEPYLPDRAR